MTDKPAAEGDEARSERDEPVKIDLDPEVALRALLKVGPESPEKDEAPPQGDPLRR